MPSFTSYSFIIEFIANFLILTYNFQNAMIYLITVHLSNFTQCLFIRVSVHIAVCFIQAICLNCAILVEDLRVLLHFSSTVTNTETHQIWATHLLLLMRLNKLPYTSILRLLFVSLQSLWWQNPGSSRVVVHFEKGSKWKVKSSRAFTVYVEKNICET